MNKIFLTVTIGPDYRLLPKFLNFYKNFGIENFLIILNTSDETPSLFLKNNGINPEKIWTDPFSEDLKQHYEREVIDRCCSDEDWIVYADLDEFQFYPSGFMNQIKFCEKHRIDFLEGRLVDRISKGGKLTELDNSVSLEKQFPLRGFITNNLLKAWDKKIVFARGRLIVGGGHHIFLDGTTYKTLPYDPDLNAHSQGIEIHHFKWDMRVLDRMKNYVQLSDDSLKAWRNEIIRFLDHYSRNNKIDISDSNFFIEENKYLINI